MSGSAAHLLSGLVRCGLCRSQLSGERAEDDHLYYSCLRSKCGQVWVEAYKLEAHVMADALSMISDPDKRLHLVALANSGVPAINVRIAESKQQLKQLDQEYSIGKLERRDFLRLRRIKYDEGERLRKLADQQIMTKLGVDRDLTPEGLVEWWATTPTNHLRRLLAMLLDHLEVYPAPDPEPGLQAVAVTYQWRTSQ